jgi:hypothetical protein
MNTIETRRYEMLVRVRDFGENHGHLFPESSQAGQQFAAVAAAVQQLEEHAVAKMSTARGGVSPKSMARGALRSRLGAISRTARAISDTTPGLEDKFQLPNPITDQGLLTAGRMFARDAEAFTALFIGHAMPATFISDLKNRVEKFEQAVRDREAGRDANTAARASIEAALSSGLAAVRKLDVMVGNRLHDDPVTMAVWERDRWVDYPNRPRRVLAPASEPAAPPPVASTTPSPPVAAPPTT